MISPLRNQKPPYRLPSGIVYFHDWRYVQHGRVGWRIREGRGWPMWITEPHPPLRCFGISPYDMHSLRRLASVPASAALGLEAGFSYRL